MLDIELPVHTSWLGTLESNERCCTDPTLLGGAGGAVVSFSWVFTEPLNLEKSKNDCLCFPCWIFAGTPSSPAASGCGGWLEKDSNSGFDTSGSNSEVSYTD